MAEKQTTEKQSTFKELVLPVIVLVVICLVCSALLAVLNDITAPIHRCHRVCDKTYQWQSANR